MTKTWKYTEPDQDNACYTEFKVFTDDKCTTEDAVKLKGAGALKVKECDATNKLLLLKCGETELQYVGGPDFGASCDDAKTASADTAKLTKVTVAAKDGKVPCTKVTLKDAGVAYISYTGSGWAATDAGNSTNTTNATGAKSLAAASAAAAIALAAMQF